MTLRRYFPDMSAAAAQYCMFNHVWHSPCQPYTLMEHLGACNAGAYWRSELGQGTPSRYLANLYTIFVSLPYCWCYHSVVCEIYVIYLMQYQ